MPWYACPAPAGFLTQTIEDFARVHHNCIRGNSLHDRLRVLAFIAAAIPMAVSVAVLFGWAFPIPQILRLRPGFPVLMTSGYVRPEDQRAAEELGIRRIIT